jgi:hypothetical protein
LYWQAYRLAYSNDRLGLLQVLVTGWVRRPGWPVWS